MIAIPLAVTVGLGLATGFSTGAFTFATAAGFSSSSPAAAPLQLTLARNPFSPASMAMGPPQPRSSPSGTSTLA